MRCLISADGQNEIQATFAMPLGTFTSKSAVSKFRKALVCITSLACLQRAFSEAGAGSSGRTEMDPEDKWTQKT